MADIMIGIEYHETNTEDREHKISSPKVQKTNFNAEKDTKSSNLPDVINLAKYE